MDVKSTEHVDNFRATFQRYIRYVIIQLVFFAGILLAHLVGENDGRVTNTFGAVMIGWALVLSTVLFISGKEMMWRQAPEVIIANAKQACQTLITFLRAGAFIMILYVLVRPQPPLPILIVIFIGMITFLYWWHLMRIQIIRTKGNQH